MKNTNDDQLTWINFARAISIISVIIQHLAGTLYNSPWLRISNCYSVTLFVFLSGITFYLSRQRHSEMTESKYLFTRIHNVIVPYLGATAIYYIIFYQAFDLKTYINYVIHFNISGPFYYIALYIQLLVAGMVIYPIIKFIKTLKNTYIAYPLFLFVLFRFSIFSENQTNILDIFGGGGKLFGATYLIVFTLGMLYADRKKKVKERYILIKGISFLIIFLLCLAFIKKYEFNIARDLIDGVSGGINMWVIIIYTFIITALLYYIAKIIEYYGTDKTRQYYQIFSRLGKYTMDIFIYHLLYRDIMILYVPITNLWIKRLLYIPIMIFMPLIFKILWIKIKEKINSTIDIQNQSG